MDRAISVALWLVLVYVGVGAHQLSGHRRMLVSRSVRAYEIGAEGARAFRRPPSGRGRLPVLHLRGGRQADELDADIGQLGLDALDDDDVLLAGDETAQEASTLSKVLDLTDDGGVKKALMRPGWKSPLLSIGDEISIAVVGREARPNGTVFLNRTEANPLVFRYGKKEVVNGLEIGVETMKLGERAIFIVRSDYAYGEERVWAGIPARATIEFEVEVLCWGAKDLSEGKGGVLFSVLEQGYSWEQPSTQDEVLISVEARRSIDGKVVVQSGGHPHWVSLAGGLLPRGLALALIQMSQGMTAQVVISGPYMFSDQQLEGAAEEWAGEHEDLLAPSPFFHPNISHWLSRRTFFPHNSLHLFGVPNLHVGGGRRGTYIYTVRLHAFNQVGLEPSTLNPKPETRNPKP